MPDVMTRGDSLREYLTGAASAGGAQTDPNASLGNHRSSTEAPSLGISIASAIANITVDFASGGNELGAGSLECTGANTLKWKDFGGSFGDVVTIANGESKILEASGRPGAFIRITRTSATALIAGTATVTLTQLINNLFGFDDVSSAEATSGDAEYRASMVQNVSAGSVLNFKRWLKKLGTSRVSAAGQLSGSGSGTISISSGNFDDWPASGWCRVETSAGSLREIVYYASRTSSALTVPAAGRGRLGTSATAGASTDLIHAVPGCRIAKDTEGVVASTEAIQTIANEGTAPASVSWATGIIAAEGLDIGTMTTTQQIGIWIHRDTPAGAVSTTLASHVFENSFDAA